MPARNGVSRLPAIGETIRGGGDRSVSPRRIDAGGSSLRPANGHPAEQPGGHRWHIRRDKAAAQTPPTGFSTPRPSVMLAARHTTRRAAHRAGLSLSAARHLAGRPPGRDVTSGRAASRSVSRHGRPASGGQHYPVTSSTHTTPRRVSNRIQASVHSLASSSSGCSSPLCETFPTLTPELKTAHTESTCLASVRLAPVAGCALQPCHRRRRPLN